MRAKQLLIHASESVDGLNIQSFSKKRRGPNKIRTSVDDIMNVVKLVDEHSYCEYLPTFCAANRIRVPVIADDLSDIAAVRLEVNQLRQHRGRRPFA